MSKWGDRVRRGSVRLSQRLTEGVYTVLGLSKGRLLSLGEQDAQSREQREALHGAR